MKKKFIVFLVFLLLPFLFICNVSADEVQSSTYIGTYIIDVPVNSSIKVYIEPKLREFVTEKGVSVYEEPSGSFFGKKKYYYFANKYINKIVGSIQLSNDVDSLIFVLNELENMAKKYDSIEYKNLVLGYIRSINIEYDQNHLDWKMVAGAESTDFIAKVNEQQTFGIRIIEFFSQFISYASFNLSIHGELDAKYRRNNDNVLFLLDPIKNSDLKIDLIHLFASIDGIYRKTHSIISLGNNAQRDIASWNGDLQQACYRFADNNESVLGISSANMDFIFSYKDSGATSYDIVADIDAMNITKTYIDFDETSINNAFSAYYRLIEKPEDRYQMFIKTVLIDEERSINGNELERLRYEIYSQFNIVLTKDGYYENCNFYDPNWYIGFGIMRVGGIQKLNNTFGQIPSKDIRAFVVDSFYNYIVNNARGIIYEEED